MKKIDALLDEFFELRVIEKWFRAQIQNKSSEHPIKGVYRGYSMCPLEEMGESIQTIKNPGDIIELIGAQFCIDNLFWGNALLAYMNKIFGNLNKCKGFNNFMTNLKNPEQFWDTISEMEFNAYFNKRFSITLEPKIFYQGDKFKKLDSSIIIDDREILFEILTPRQTEKSRSGKAEFIKNRAKDKLLDKLDSQIKPISNVIDAPLIMVINSSYSEFDETLVKEALFGQTQVTMLKNTKTREIIDVYVSRAQNALMDSRPEASIISAILVYNRIISVLGMEFKTELILNEKARYPLMEKECDCLRKFNLMNIK